MESSSSGSSSSPNFFPIGIEQWIMLASVHNAKVAYNRRIQQGNAKSSPAFDSVITVCPIFEHERELLNQIVSFYCDHVRVLARSTATEYNMDRSLPFLQGEEAFQMSLTTNSVNYAVLFWKKTYLTL